MESKLQEKFALVQQMKREKELKEAKAKDNPIDIFAIAGVSIPGTVSGGTAGIHHSSRNDNRRPCVERTGSSFSGRGGTNSNRRLSQSSSSSSVKSPLGRSERLEEQVSSGAGLGASVRTGESTGTVKKLKRSSMAARNSAQGQEQKRQAVENAHSALSPREEHAGDLDRGRQLSICSVTSSGSTSGSAALDSPSTVTPPTPIPSPMTEDVHTNKADTVSNKRSRSDSQQTEELARDMTHNVAHSRGNSVESNEEMVLDSYGRSIPLSRHQSSDEGSDHEHNRHTRRERDTRHRQSGYDDDCTNRSPSPNTSSNTGTFADPYVAASRYLDTAFYPTKVYVGHLPESVSLTALRTAFGPFGEIEDMNLVEGKDFGFVTFKEPEAARRALEAMNGATIDGAVIKVNRAMIPERNRRGFAGVAWTDEDGELAKLEEEQHRQAAAMAGNILPPRHASSDLKQASEAKTMDTVSSTGGASYGTRGPSQVAPIAVRSVHQLPPRPRSPKLPPKPTGAAAFPPAEMGPGAAAATTQGRGRRILSYDDL
ncbi:RNA-binding protein 39 [Mortierella alpina]|nr:RNA-binding protein 39 [Mortierella alpina]